MNDTPKVKIAKRIAQEFQDGYFVNLGAGVPELAVNYLPQDVHVTIHSENGIVGMGPLVDQAHSNPNIVNSGRKYCSIEQGACFVDSATSFALVRGGHVDVTVLGVYEVDAEGSISSHRVPGKAISGMGGAMDLLSGVKKIIIATTHVKRNGDCSIVNKLSLPVTGVKKANMIITDLAVFHFTPEGLELAEIAPEESVEHLREITKADFYVSDQLKTIDIS